MSNSIHFIDLFMFLTNAKKIKIESVSFKKRLNHPGKTIMKFMVKLAFLIKKETYRNRQSYFKKKKLL